MVPGSAGQVVARPYRWPWHGPLDPDRTALLCIDWQRDFCAADGYLARLGGDLAGPGAALAVAASVLAAARAAGLLVVHTREGHRDDLSDCPPAKRWRTGQAGAGIGEPGPLGRFLVRGEPGWGIVEQMAPRPGEPVVDKPGRGAFYATDLDLLLRSRGVSDLVLTGLTTDVCVHSTMREASDRGYDCLVVEDACAAGVAADHRAALEMLQREGGVFGAVTQAAELLAVLDARPSVPSGG